jgi:hypothetical protein
MVTLFAYTVPLLGHHIILFGLPLLIQIVAVLSLQLGADDVCAYTLRLPNTSAISCWRELRAVGPDRHGLGSVHHGLDVHTELAIVYRSTSAGSHDAAF